MPTITIRVTEEMKAELESLAAGEGATVSELIRDNLPVEGGRRDAIGGILGQLEQLWARLERLERLANL